MSITLESWQIGMGTVIALLVMVIVVTKCDLPKHTAKKLSLLLVLFSITYLWIIIVNGLMFLFGCTL